MTHRIVMIAILSILAACATMRTYRPLTLHLYDVAGATMLVATATNEGTGHGAIVMLLPSGERVVGEYTTLAGGVSGWGSIYALGTVGGTTASVSGGNQYAIQPNEQQGSFAAVGDRGTAIQCEYLVNAQNHGHGGCKDNKGTVYKLLY